MKQHHARLLLALLVALAMGASPARALAANACADGGRARPEEGGIGGTGARDGSGGDDGIGGTGAHPAAPADDGIGGTGIHADTDGIGGTGIQADTGIIGTITGFGSICVGGVEIRYDADTPLRIDGEAARATDLAVGQVVEVVASGGGSELDAKEISVRHIVSGPVTAVDAEQNQIGVAGQTVQLSGETTASTSSYALDTPVQVSGMRRGDGVIVATRVTNAEGGGAVTLSGTLSRLESGALAIDGTEIRGAGVAAAEIGNEMRVAGSWVAGAIQLDSIEAVSSLPFDGRVARVEIEGYVHASSRGELRVGAIAIADTSALDWEKRVGAEARVHIEAVVRDRRVIVERVEVMKDLPGGPPRPEGGDGRGFRKGSFEDHSGRDDGGKVGGPPEGMPPHDDFGEGGHRPEPRDAGAPRGDHPDGPEGHHPDMAPPPDRPEGAGPPDRADGAGPPDRPEMSGPPDRPDRPDHGDHPDMPDRPAMPDRPERPPRPDVAHPPDRPDRPAPPDRPERPDRPDAPPPRPDRGGPPEIPRFQRPDLPRRN